MPSAELVEADVPDNDKAEADVLDAELADVERVEIAADAIPKMLFLPKLTARSSTSRVWLNSRPAKQGFKWQHKKLEEKNRLPSPVKKITLVTVLGDNLSLDYILLKSPMIAAKGERLKTD